MNFCMQHTSDESLWFKKSVERDPYYENFYVWQPGIPSANPSERPLPPNNWVSIFRYSAWEWNEQREEYYLHQFVPGQVNVHCKIDLKKMKILANFSLI